MNRLSFSSFALFASLILLIPGCKKENPVETQDLVSMTIGPTVDVSSTSIGPTGGTIKVTKPGTPVDGMEIVIPDSSYTSGKTYSISYAEIVSHKFGENFNPISPMITIRNGGGYANELLTVEVPVEIPKGHFAMGFLYNEVTRELEGMPILAIKEKSVVVATRHFATSSLEGTNAGPLLKGMNKLTGDAVMGNLIISAISIEKLKKQTDIVSDFEPGSDDWEFTNYGSFLSPDGICSGMCLSALWYYIQETSNGNTKLFHKYDQYTIANYSNLWQDNFLGIRLGSMVQSDYQNNNKTYENAIDAIAMDKSKDSLSWYALAYTILQTKQPQFIGIMSSAGGGHVLIANDVWMQDGKLWISDPNHPGNKSLNILYTNREFEPYYASLNAAENPFNFEYIAYYGKTAVVDWGLLSQRWDELKMGTIGNGVFPEVKLWVEDPTGVTAGWELADEFKTDLDTLSLDIKNNGKWEYSFAVFNQEGYQVVPSPGKEYSMTYIGDISLSPGLNTIGYCIYHKSKDQDGNVVWDWTDFKWIDVYYAKLKIDPDTIAGEPEKEIEITAKSDGTAPKSAKYVWNFGDGSAEVTVNNDSLVRHVFLNEGSFNVVARLYDNSNNLMVAADTAVAIIVKGNLSRLQKCQYATIQFSADMMTNEGFSFGGLHITNRPPTLSDGGNCPLIWGGATFSAKVDYTGKTYQQGETQHITGIIQGTLSANGLIVQTLTAHLVKETNTAQTTTQDISVINIPYDTNRPGNLVYEVKGPSVSSFVPSFSWQLVYYEGVVQKVRNIASVNYNNPNDVPRLSIYFEER